MAEWLKATVLKTVMGRPIVSSNLTASSKNKHLLVFFCLLEKILNNPRFMLKLSQ